MKLRRALVLLPALMIASGMAAWKRYIACSLTSSMLNRPEQLKILSWNVASLRSMLKRESGDELRKLVEREQPDITFLQEHKLQDIHVPKVAPELLRIFDLACPGESHRATWAVSKARKGYSGVCAIYRQSVGGGVLRAAVGEVDEVDAAEGRSVRLDLQCGLIVVGIYSPNSGQRLARLDYRVSVWDSKLRSYLKKLDTEAGCEGGLLLCGDLNVAHEDIDFWNPTSARTRRQAGTTPQERQSFTAWLAELDMIDMFRFKNPETEGVFTYWNRRTNGRPANKGMRLDYFLGSRRLCSSSQVAVSDCQVLGAFGGSDHCPISCVVEVAK
ncbi:unnamed protein product [Effrenium voratum]|uniref:Endonuclease/exonuclease/phosphatase domain-containing protein n=1 Tax=Effrenium voratum TaxID=2562239 RepID=A0AA36HYU2_9DINO|nr:unnamed protein product [Effrenium voratum]CAJ1377862.1 unnamed protein product [Effrenium voratum]CAJ1460267.1 unnamed protein product [Effrenium voratum]